MSTETGFSRFICDRPASAHKDGKEKREYIKDSDTAKHAKWHKVKHRDQYGEEVEYTLCDDCYEKYKELAAQYDTAVINFIGGIEEVI